MSNRKYISDIPDLMAEWDWEANDDLEPTKITYGCNKKTWWKCSKCGHKWEARIDNRAHGRGCPCCAGKIVIVGKNDLSTTYPDLAKEWHPTKNGSLQPINVMAGCNKKVWWLCPCGHEYQATVNHRTGNNGTGCPVCYGGRQTSFAEQAFYFYIKKLFPDAVNRYKADFLGKMELDIYIPSINWAIEYDGMAFHKEDKLNREREKYRLCRKQGIKLIRFREKKITLGQDIADELYHIPDMSNSKNLQKIIIFFLKKLDFADQGLAQVNPFGVDIQRDRIQILKNCVAEYKKGSLGELYPELAKEWHPTKNEGLTPYGFKPMSDHKVWWVCPKCGHEYQATIGHRVSGTGCIKCGIKRSNDSKKKSVNMINSETGQIIEKFLSITEASKKMGINPSNISMVCKGIRPKAGGYIWKYADEKETQKYKQNKKQLEFDFESDD